MDCKRYPCTMALRIHASVRASPRLHACEGVCMAISVYRGWGVCVRVCVVLLSASHHCCGCVGDEVEGEGVGTRGLQQQASAVKRVSKHRHHTLCPGK